MLKKQHDRMVRKAQIKIFIMIISILLAVFLAVIIGINVMTKAVMRGQSKEVLQQIAADLEYNDQESFFYFPREENRNDDKGSVPLSKPSKPSDAATTVTPDTTSGGTQDTNATDVPENTDSQTDDNGSEPDIPPESAPDTQPVETDTTLPWSIFPTMPEDATFPDMSQGGWGGQDWGNNGWNWGSGDGQQWNGTWGDNGWNWGSGDGQQWSSWGGQQGSSSSGSQGGSWGGQQGSSSSGSQGGSWNQNGGNQNWNGWYWDGKQWKNQDGSTWDGKGTPPWFEVETTADGKNSDWWSGSNPYNIWSTDNPMNPMNPNNPYNQWSKKVKEGESDGSQSDEISQEFQKYGGATDTGNEDSTAGEPVLEQTANSGSYEMVQLAGGTSTAPVSGSRSAQGRSNVRNVTNAENIPKSIGSINYFAIMADTNGKYLNKMYNDDLSTEKAQKYISAILNANYDTGMINSYQFYKTSKPNGTIMIFSDKSYEISVLEQLKRTTIIIGFIALIVLSVLSYFLSKKTIQPVQEAFDKQKQFVSDASHELKTPLTVISTNADVLEGEIGKNKWLDYIKSQTERMSVLVNDLLNLTRLENSNNELERRYFNLSKAITNTALPFECQAFESNKKFEVNIEDNIMLNGSEKHIKQMAAIFIDNALKYSNDGGTIQVTLKRSGERKLFSVYNTGQGIKETDTEKIFERFYRSDESRNRATGGYGLGLAIAKSVADKHKFKIHVLNQPGKGVCFIVTM